MSNKYFNRQAILVVSLVFLAELSHILWEHFNGGVISHHFLNRSDMPSISNWWGLLWLPLLAWISILFIQKRESNYPPIVAGFVCSLIYAASLSFCFTYGFEAATEIMFPALFVLAIFIPFYRAEYILGFIFGMTYTVGAILPTFFATVFALISVVSQLLILPLLLSIFRRLKSRTASNKSA